MRYALFILLLCGITHAEDKPALNSEPALLDEIHERSLRIFILVQKKDAKGFAAVATQAFGKTANVEKLCDKSITAVRFDRVDKVDGLIRARLNIAYNAVETGEPVYIHYLYLYFLREAGELKLNDYQYVGW